MDEEPTPANEANTFAANILAQPTEGEVDNSRDGTPVEATARSEPEVLPEAVRDAHGNGDREDRIRTVEGQSVSARSAGEQDRKSDPTPTAEPPEDLSVREARDAFPDDGYGM